MINYYTQIGMTTPELEWSLSQKNTQIHTGTHPQIPICDRESTLQRHTLKQLKAHTHDNQKSSWGTLSLSGPLDSFLSHSSSSITLQFLLLLLHGPLAANSGFNSVSQAFPYHRNGPHIRVLPHFLAVLVWFGLVFLSCPGVSLSAHLGC